MKDVTKEKMREMLSLLAEQHGKNGKRATQMQLAGVLSASDRTVRDAMKGKFSAKFARHVHEKLYGHSDFDGVENASRKIGRWIIGAPETRARDVRIIEEVVVTHISDPVFVLQLELRKGEVDGGDYATTVRTHFLTDSSDDKKSRMIELAREKAMSVALDRIRQAEEIKLRAQHIRKARMNGADESDLRKMSTRELTTTAIGVTGESLRQDLKKISQELTELGAVTRGMSAAERDAMNVGEIIGSLKTTYKAISIAEETGREVATAVAARAYALLPLAHPRTTRGKIQGDAAAK